MTDRELLILALQRLERILERLSVPNCGDRMAARRIREHLGEDAD